MMTKRLANAWTNTLRTTDGAIVLADLLTRLGHFKMASKSEDVALQNFAKHLLADLDLYTGKDTFPLDYVDALHGRRPEPKKGFWAGLFNKEIT